MQAWRELHGLEILPPEITVSILAQLSVKQILAVTRVSTVMAGFGWNWTLWSIKAEEDVQFPRKLFHETRSPNPRWRYREARYYFRHPDNALLQAAKLNSLELLNYAMMCGANKLKQALSRAAFKGHLEMIRLIFPLTFITPEIQKINWLSPYNPLCQAALGGHIDVFNYFVEVKGSLDYINLRFAINNAALGGHLDLIESLSTRQPRNLYHYHVLDGSRDIPIDPVLLTPSSLFSSALIRASSKGHYRVVDYILSYGLDRFTPSCLARSLNQAIDNGHHQVARSLISLGIRVHGGALIRAARSGSLDLIKHLLSILTTQKNNNFLHHVNQAFLEACRRGHLDIVIELWSHGTTQLVHGLYHAAEMDYSEVIATLIEMDRGDSLSKSDLNLALTKAAYWGHIKSVKLLVELGADQLDLALIESLIMRQFTVAQWIIDFGYARNLWSRDNLDVILIMVATHGSLDLVKTLIAMGAQDRDYAAIRALQGGHFEIVSYLVDLGLTNLDYLQQSLAAALMQKSDYFYVHYDYYRQRYNMAEKLFLKIAMPSTESS